MSHFFAQTYLARANAPYWQRLLRRSVRLYLALEEPAYNPLEVEASLQLVEWQLRWHLLGEEPASAEAQAQVLGFIESAQAELLHERFEIADLLREPLSDLYRVPLTQTSYLSRVAATGCGGTAAVRELAQAYWAAP